MAGVNSRNLPFDAIHLDYRFSLDFLPVTESPTSPCVGDGVVLGLLLTTVKVSRLPMEGTSWLGQTAAFVATHPI
jgi:hypothetical protein